MSASSKKKLRNAEQAEKLTEKQLAEQKEAKKLKLYTTLAVVILVALVVFAAYVGVSRASSNSGIRERNTVALTIGEHKISNAELNYYFIDSVNQFYNQYGSYASLLGLDVTKPLNQQVLSGENRMTWADDFLESAIENAKATYALVDEANANGYTLPEEALATIDSAIETMELYAPLYGYSDAKTYLKAMYGKGATEESLRNYYETTELARYYQNEYTQSLNYSDDELRAAEAENYGLYSSFSYNYYYLNAFNFIEKEDETTTTYTDEQKAEGAKLAEEAAKALTTGITTVEELDAAIAALPINADNELAASYVSTDVSYNSMFAAYAEWMADPARKAGDITYVANTTTDDAGNVTINGYYVVMFGSRNDNTFALANVRHILVGFEGGTYNSTTGAYDYTDVEKAAAWAEAEAILTEWKAGEASEESFAALANEKSDDGDGTTGGLYEDVYPGQMVTAFNDWCFDAHEIGDTAIVETEYGCHVMFYSGESETTYRDYLISNALASADYNAWYTALIEAATVTEHDFDYISMNLVLSAS